MTFEGTDLDSLWNTIESDADNKEELGKNKIKYAKF